MFSFPFSKLGALAAFGMMLAAAPPARAQLTDSSLVLEAVVATGTLSLPTSLAFLGNRDVLVTEKATGRVRRVLNGTALATPVLDLPVNSVSERGLLHIVRDPDWPAAPYFYTYHTAAATDGGTAIEHRVSRWTWNGTALGSGVTITTLPVTAGPNHDGGPMVFGPPTSATVQQKLYVVIGDLNRTNQTQNYPAGAAADDSGVVIRINRDGTTPSGADRGPFFAVAGGNPALARMYAYGVRNSFGLDFDPVTGDLWDTENGAALYDEVNRVLPGFNSGWRYLMGPASRNNLEGAPSLVQFGGVGTYADPAFSWQSTVAPTSMHFVRGIGLGVANQNVCLVADFNGGGKLYRFPMNAQRTGFDLAAGAGLGDLVLDSNGTDSVAPFILWNNTGGLTDIESAPDQTVFATSYSGQVYRIRASSYTGISDWRAFE